MHAAAPSCKAAQPLGAPSGFVASLACKENNALPR